MATSQSTSERCDVHSLAAWQAIFYLEIGTLSVDSEGRIWRHFVHDGSGGRKRVAPRRAEFLSNKGYLSLSFGAHAGGYPSCRIGAHRVVWLWLKGPISAGMQINHKNLNKTDNRPDNLEVVTQSENIRHSYANGRLSPWHKADVWRGKPRITDEQKQEMCRLRSEGMKLREIGDLFDLKTTHVWRIVKGGGR